MSGLEQRFVLLSGCSGGGKSTLLAELARRGHAVVEEPGRRIVASELATGGRALPWSDLEAFLHRAVEMACADMEAARDRNGFVFFDRGLVDAASALGDLKGERAMHALYEHCRYRRQVFMAPPWPQIYATDSERRHTYEAAVAEYRRLERDLPALGHDAAELPKATVAERADFLLASLG